MELQMRTHDWSSRAPDWLAAAVAGLVAGAVLMVLELAWSASMADSPWRIPRMVAAMVTGTEALQSSGFSLGVVALALFIHYLLGVLFGMVVGFIIAGFHYETSAGMMQLIGIVFGVLLYWINFHGMSRFFPWFAELRGWSTFIAHLLFGMVAAFMYWKLERIEEVEPQRST